MPNAPTNAWEGHGPMLGVDTRTHPATLDSQFSSGAVNRTFRGGQNKTRPPIQAKTLKFATPEDEQSFKMGGVSAFHPYEKSLKGTQPYIIVVVGEKILKGRIFSNTIELSTLYDLKTPEFMHGWFIQALDRLYYQNGENDPVGWDGRGEAYEIEGGLSNDTMPIGTNMEYIHGRIVVFTASNNVIVSDHIAGAGLADTRGAENFIEAQATDDIGAFVTPAELDSITGSAPIPRTPDKDAQGDLLVLTRRGGYAIRLTGLRTDWLTGDIQQIVMTGVGGAATTSVVPANNDIWFRTSKGAISSYKYERSEQDRTWGDTSLSREVSEYLELDSPRNLKFCASILAHNRLITTCALTVRPNDISGYSHHHFGQGMVVLDFDRGSTVNNRVGFAWDGLWTGVNVIDFASVTVDSEIRPLMISHDEDGENRIYEFMPEGYVGSDMAEGQKKLIVSFYETPHLFDQRDHTQKVVGKKLIGGRAEVSGVDCKSSFSIQYRPNYLPCWLPWIAPLSVGAAASPQLTELVDQKQFYDILRWPAPDEDNCEEASTRLTHTAAFFSARILVTGNMQINQLQLLVDVYDEEDLISCNDDERQERFEDLITCSEPGLFGYKIVEVDGTIDDSEPIIIRLEPGEKCPVT